MGNKILAIPLQNSWSSSPRNCDRIAVPTILAIVIFPRSRHGNQAEPIKIPQRATYMDASNKKLQESSRNNIDKRNESFK